MKRQEKKEIKKRLKKENREKEQANNGAILKGLNLPEGRFITDNNIYKILSLSG